MQVRLLDFTTLDTQLLSMVLGWRNHSDVRRWMVNSEEISMENHLHFVESLKNRTDKRYFLVQREDEYIGVIDFIDITQNSAEIGIYTNPQLRGVGEILMKTLVEYAFVTLHLTTLIASVFADNDRAKYLYKKFDFIETERTSYNEREMITMELNQ